jgi:hypothetical protein
LHDESDQFDEPVSRSDRRCNEDSLLRAHVAIAAESTQDAATARYNARRNQ